MRSEERNKLLQDLDMLVIHLIAVDDYLGGDLEWVPKDMQEALVGSGEDVFSCSLGLVVRVRETIANINNLREKLKKGET